MLRSLVGSEMCIRDSKQQVLGLRAHIRNVEDFYKKVTALKEEEFQTLQAVRQELLRREEESIRKAEERTGSDRALLELAEKERAFKEEEEGRVMEILRNETEKA